MTPKVSVITPIYNVAKFLPQCLDSLLAQTLQDIEFICVNDGSTDNCLDILNAYAARDSRIVVIDKPNGGYGHTMNTGIDAARGEYIGIVESDDWVNRNAFEKLYELAEAHDHCDIVKANHNVFVGDDKPVPVENFPESLCGRTLSPLDPDGGQVLNSIPAIWSAIYRRDFLNDNGIRFLETPGASFQDTGFVYKSWIASNTFVLTHDAYLNYRLDNAGSSVQSVAKVLFVCDEFASIEAFLAARPDRSEKLIGRVLAKKFDTYNWNYDRIAWEYREEFLDRIADEFAAPLVARQLDPSVFKEGEFDRLLRIIEDPHSVYENDLKEYRRSQIESIPQVAKDAIGSRIGAFQQTISEIPVKHRLKRPNQYEDRKVSIIVPIYNSERYLDKTIGSLIGQTHKNIEIICVNDGSTDGSLAKLNEYAARDGRIIVFDTENEGQTKARNVRIDNATGDFFCFVDADDFVSRTMIEQTVNAAESNNAEVVLFGIDEYHDDTKRYFPMPHAVVKGKIPKAEVFDPRSVDDFFVYMVGFTVNKLYRMSYFKTLDLKFPVIGAHEDMPFTYAAVAPAHRVFYLDKVLYHYRRERVEGSRSDDTEEQYAYMLKALECMRSELMRLGVFEDYRRDFENYVAHMSRWKFESIFGKPRRQFYEKLCNGWLESMGVFGHDDDYFYDENTRRFARNIQTDSYIDLVEQHAELILKELKEVYESKSFRLGEMIAAPVRMIRGNEETTNE